MNEDTWGMLPDNDMKKAAEYHADLEWGLERGEDWYQAAAANYFAHLFDDYEDED